jgi:aspartyl-tRNA synthetase
MTYAEAMRRYGSDKPDLRIALEFVDVAEQVKGCEFAVFTAAANDPDGRVVALRIPGGASLSRKQIDDYAAHAPSTAPRAWPTPRSTRPARSIRRSPSSSPKGAFDALLRHVGAGNGDIVFFGAGAYNKTSDFMGAVRLKAGKDFNLVADGWAPLWVTDFPMFEWDDEAQRYVALHHPFTAPAVDSIADLRANAKTAVSRGYDMVLNGNEIGGGSIRIHNSAMQSRGVRAARHRRGRSGRQVRLPAGRAEVRRAAARRHRLRHRPHRRADGRHDSIRDVIAFPKTTTAQCLMTGAPSEVPDKQLAEVHVSVRARE